MTIFPPIVHFYLNVEKQGIFWVQKAELQVQAINVLYAKINNLKYKVA